jgi:predicted metal-binding membrane protein
VSSTEAEAAGGSAVGPPLPALGRPLSRNGLIAGAALVLAAGLAWYWLMATGMSAMPMDGHAMGATAIEPWSIGYLAPAFFMWAVMMVAMMLPSAAPMILLHARIDRAPTSARRLAHTLLFALAYLIVWTGFSVAAVLAQVLLIELGLISAASLAVTDRAAAAALLIAAALYQLSSAKAACLDQCRSPIHFVMRFWSPGLAGALRLGIVHGLSCVGCCWGLMLLLFVAGVMNLAWVALLGAIVLVEKMAPRAWHLSKVLAVLLLAAGVALVATG